MTSSLSSLSFLRAFTASEKMTVALRAVLVNTALVLPCDLTEAEREDVCDLITLFTELPVQIAVRDSGLRAGHVCLLTEPVVGDPVAPSGSVIVARRAPAVGRRRLDASLALRALSGALLEVIGTAEQGPRIADIARWAEHVADSPSIALRFAAAAHAADLATPDLPDASLMAEGLAEVVASLLRGIDPRVAEWVVARALPAKSYHRLVSTEAAILGERPALQRALAGGLVEHLHEEEDVDDVLDLRLPLALLRRLEDLPVALEWPAIAACLKSRLHPQAYAVIERWLHARPRPLRLMGPLRRPDFIGREDVMARLLALFEPAREVRTAVLYGMQGLGKSAFAAALCERVSDSLETVWLSFAEGPEAAWRLVADALGLDAGLMRDEPRSGGLPAWLRQVHARMAERFALIVVDNAERVAESELGAWLPKGLGSCSVLVLSTRAERALQRENDAISVALRPLSEEEARTLLASKVPALKDGIADGDTDRLLQRLDGHPSAIGLVAALLGKTSTVEVTELVERGPDSLRGLVRHAVESFDAEERAVVEALSVAAPAGSSRKLVTRMVGGADIRPAILRLADRAVVELGARTVKLFGVVQLAIETGMDDARRREMEWAHAEAVDDIMEAARNGGQEDDEEELDVLHVDAVLALGRMAERCRLGEEPAVFPTYNLARGLSAYPRGSRSETLNAVIAGYQAALHVWTRESHPTDWADVQNNLGEAFGALPTGDRTGNLLRALEAQENALTIRTREAYPIEWAGLQNNLGNAFANLPTGNRAANLGRAIGAYENALLVCTRDTDPDRWAMVQNNLGGVYASLPEGDREENIRRAIAAYECALAVHTKESSPVQWAMILHNWSSAMTALRSGNRNESLRRAIAALEQVLTVRSPDVFPEDWALTQGQLGTTLSQLTEGDHLENVSRAVDAYRASLRVFTKGDFSWKWALTQLSLAIALMSLPGGTRRQTLREAIECLRSALSIYTKDAFPEEHNAAQATLNEALAELAALGPATDPPPSAST